MQKPSPRGRSSSINPGPGAAVEWKTPGVARGGCWCLELTDALQAYFQKIQSSTTRHTFLYWGCSCRGFCQMIITLLITDLYVFYFNYSVLVSGKLTVRVKPFNGTGQVACASAGYMQQQTFLLTFVGVIYF